MTRNICRRHGDKEIVDEYMRSRILEAIPEDDFVAGMDYVREHIADEIAYLKKVSEEYIKAAPFLASHNFGGCSFEEKK